MQLQELGTQRMAIIIFVNKLSKFDFISSLVSSPVIPKYEGNLRQKPDMLISCIYKNVRLYLFSNKIHIAQCSKVIDARHDLTMHWYIFCLFKDNTI